MKKAGRRRKRFDAVVICLFICALAVYLWTQATEPLAHRMPRVEQIPVEDILEKAFLSKEDYLILSEQTGLSREALVYMDEQGRREEWILLQKAYFRPVKVACIPNSIISREEYVVDELGNPARGTRIPYIEEGDILITCCSHVFGWRNGHAALVVDAARRLVLEAQVLGSPSVIISMDHWEEYPSFMVLRLRGADKKERAEIAEYAVKYLAGVPYHVTAGIFDRWQEENRSESPGGTHCAHLVWYAYRQFGYDLDSDGGLIVTPGDLAGSKKLKVIQKYGT